VPTPLLTTKLYLPLPRPDLVSRPHLIDQLNVGLSCKLTLISAPAGFGKTTLLSSWAKCVERPVAWLSLDEGDNDLSRFLTYFVAALQTIKGNIGEEVLVALQSPGSFNVEIVLTALLNEIIEITDGVVLILDDYHVIESPPIDKAITYLLKHQPPQMHLVIASRIDPSWPLSNLRARGQMKEIRADDLRFSPEEATAFLNQVMGFDLSIQDVTALEARTEGWITGLQLAAISMKGFKENSEVIDFINRFSGSDRYIQDYLADEVLQQRPKGTRDFLLQTSILNRLSAPLCDAVTAMDYSQTILENLEAANLFIVPLDNDRRWYRYHHLFTDLLRQRLHQGQTDLVTELHIRASAWFEKNDLEIEALQHAAAANDFERAAHLVEGGGHPLYHRGEVAPVLNWLESLTIDQLNNMPSLWVMYAEVLMTKGQHANAEKKYQIAEKTLQNARPDPNTRDLLGRIANGRASLAFLRGQAETTITLAHRALDLLLPENLAIRSAVSYSLGHAYQLQDDRSAARQAFTEAIDKSEAAQHMIVTMLALIRLGDLLAADNQLYQAVETYQRSLQLAGEHPLPYNGEAYLGLARVFYEWNDLDTSLHNLHQAIHLLRQIDNFEKIIICEILLARLNIAQGDVVGTAANLDKVYQSAHQHHLTHLIPEVAAVQVLLLLRHANPAAAAQLAQRNKLPISQIRVHLAQGDTSSALSTLDTLREQMKAKNWKDEILKIMVLQAVTLYMHGEKDNALKSLNDALVLAEPIGFVRTFVDEGEPMAQLLYETASRGIMPDYTSKLLAAFESEKPSDTTIPIQPLDDPLSPRELEVLQLVAKGLTNREVAEMLFLALDTIKWHNRHIYGKLGVKNRTQAINKAISLKIIPPQ